MAERAELHGLGDDGHVDADLGGRILHVIGDPVDEEWDVIEEVLSREYAIPVERDATGDPVQPLQRQIVPGES